MCTCTGEVCDPPAVCELSAGDGVRVELDPELFKIAQEDHGGWENFMAEYIGRDGIAQSIMSCGDVVVRYKNSKILHVNRHCLTLVECCNIDYGDVVRMSDDMAEVHQLQCGHGEWANDMALALGQAGRVVKIRANGDIRVAVNGSRWVFNPKCLTPAPGEVPIEEQTGQLHVDVTVRIQTLSLSEAGCADVVVVAAAGGDLRTLTSYLSKHPDHVNTMYEGKAAIHMAVVESYLPIVRLLIEYQADLNVKDDGNQTTLHMCAYLNNGAVAKLLVDGGADVNVRDDSGVAPLAVAVACGHTDVLKVLLDHPDIDVDTQDNDGSSPLHRAMRAHQLHSLIALLQAGADPSLLNFRLHNSMLKAVGLGFLAGVEELMKWCPDLINVAKKDGLTPLHVAAANGYTDIVSLLASHPSCDINMKDSDNLTPLHIAAHEGYPVMVERLVGFGADLNSSSSDGNTPLHLTLGRRSMSAPSTLSPHILEVKRELDLLCGPDTLKANVIVGVFLVREGANIHTVNRHGLHPLSVRPPDVAQLVNSYATMHTKPTFHGKLRQTESPFTDLSPKSPRKPVRAHRKPQLTSPTATTVRPADKPTDSLKTINRSVNVNTHSPALAYDKDINPYAKMAAASALDAAAGTCRLEPCSLCEDNPISIMFQPCGHVTLCHVCGSRAKRCMRKECRAEVKNVIKLCPVCCKNQPDETHTTCIVKHKLCRGCIARSSTCVLCHAVLLKAPE
jgi:ankyrin repeat protein